MGSQVPSERPHRRTEVQYGLNTPQQSTGSYDPYSSSYSQSALSYTSTDSKMCAITPFFSDAPVTDDPKEEDLNMSSPSPMSQAQARGTPAQQSTATSYDIPTDEELNYMKKLAEINEIRARTAAYEAEVAQKRAGKGHTYGDVIVRGNAIAIRGNSYDGEVPPLLGRINTYGKGLSEGNGLLKDGDLSQATLLALTRDRRSPPAAAIGPKQQSSQKQDMNHQRRRYRNRRRSDQPEE